jgi:signal transduction histidine kinase
MVSQSIDTFYQQAAQKRIVIINEIASKQKAFADEKMIEKVLRNFLSDAIKFTNKDGKVIVKSEPSGNGTIEVSVEDKGVE